MDESDNNIEDMFEINTEVNTNIIIEPELVEIINKNNMLIQNNNINKCKYCNKVYSRYDSILRHINKSSCKQKKELDDINALNVNGNSTEHEKYIICLQLINMLVDKSKMLDELKNKYDNNIKNTNNILSDEVNINKMKESSTLVLNDIVIIARSEDNFINATQLCKAGNTKFSLWYRLDTTKELIKELENSYLINSKNADVQICASGNFQNSDMEINDNIINSNNLDNINTKNCDVQICASQKSKNSKTGIPVLAFVKINKGNSSKFTQGTWIHPDLAIQLAQWISPKFALQVSKWIRTLFTTGTVSINDQLLEENNMYKNELKLKDEKIQLLQNSFIKKQSRKDYPEKYVIYMLTSEDHKKKRIYIIGKATNLKQRLSNYNKSCEHEVVYYKACHNEENMTIIESLVINKLKIYREQSNRDRFILPSYCDITLFTNIIDDCIRYVIS